MKYKTLAVAVGSVILFAGCNDSLIFKRLNKTEEWLEAAEAKLKATEAELESTKTELESERSERLGFSCLSVTVYRRLFETASVPLFAGKRRSA